MIRLNKFLAAAGIASRRRCDDFIQDGRVKVNGEIITKLGHRIDEDNDHVAFDDIPVKPVTEKKYIIFNKPKGVITSTDDPYERNTVLDMIPIKERIFPVGRLDYDTTGLLLLTNDGPLTNKLIHPRYKIEKKYLVLVDKIVRPIALYHLRRGIEIDGKKTAPCKISEIRVIDNCSYLEVILYEGRNRQIRRMFESQGYQVTELERITFGPLTLRGLTRGSWRYLSKSEIHSLHKYLKDIETKS